MTDLFPKVLTRVRRSARPEAAALARAAGPSGVYVANALLVGEDGSVDLHGRFDADGVMVALVWVGRRGNLVVLGDVGPAVRELARELLAIEASWRIALAPRAVVDALATCERATPLVCRSQVYYAGSQALLAAAVVGPVPEVRAAVGADLAPLCEAAIALNEVDLHVPRARVHVGWLQKTVRRRIREGRTFVIGPPGAPVCKLDVGSRGPAGAVIEGVFTTLGARGRGHATALVWSVTRHLLQTHATVCLHVDEDNLGARRAYERAGLAAATTCGLLLRNG